MPKYRVTAYVKQDFDLELEEGTTPKGLFDAMVHQHGENAMSVMVEKCLATLNKQYQDNGIWDNTICIITDQENQKRVADRTHREGITTWDWYNAQGLIFARFSNPNNK